MDYHLGVYVYLFLVTIRLFHIAMKDPPFLIGKPSISMGHFPWLSEITRE
jgi:hypothetical protein